MKLHNLGLQSWARGMCLTAALAGLSLSVGWGVAWAAPVNTFDHTTSLPTPIYLGWGDAVPVPADYTGDGRADLAVYSESSGMWYTRTMAKKRVYELQLGGPGYRACPADYDGDGKADPAVYGNGVWGAALSSQGYAVATLELGASGSTPVPADYDGDGKADPAVYRESDGQWSVALSTRGYAVETLELGASGFAPVPADYDGDGKADPAVYSRTLGLWAVALSASGYAVQTRAFDVPDATPVVGDFDGDGKTDLAIYHDATGLWLGCMSGSGYALSYQRLGGGGYVPVTGRFYHTQRHTFGVYQPSTGAWLVQYTPALVGDGDSSGGVIFGSILSGLTDGVGDWVVHGAVGWVLDLLTKQSSGDQTQQMSQQLTAMGAQMTTLIGMSSNLLTQVNSFEGQFNIDINEVNTSIEWVNAQAAVGTITTHYDQGGDDSMATFCSPTFTNYYPNTNKQQSVISNFAVNVDNGSFAMADSVTFIDQALMPTLGVGGEAGLLQLWTTTFILTEVNTADSLYDFYRTLEYNYAYLYSYLMKGASTYVDAQNYLDGNDGGYVSVTLTPMINKEVDQFQQCTYQLLLSEADFVNNFSTNAAFAPIGAATNILFRNMFMAAQARGTNAYGLNAMILATMDAVTNGMPSIVAFYNWMPSPEVNQRGPDASTYNSQPAVQYFSPVISNWISVTGPAYDYWSNGRMHATNQYAFLQYGFGTNLPLGNYPWYFLRSQPYNPAQQYGNPINIGRYDDSLNVSSTGNPYGFFLAQLRNGGPSFFANSGASYFSHTSTTYQALADTTHQGAFMSTAVQYPAGTNVVVVSVMITNGPLGKLGNTGQGGITVNAYALWSFIYDGQTSVTGALQYQAATYGSFMTASGHLDNGDIIKQSRSFVAQIDVFDVTANSVCASNVVKSYASNSAFTKTTTIPLGTNTPPRSLPPIQFQPGHEYQVRAHWDCSMDENEVDGSLYNENWLLVFALNASLAVQGLAITFDN